MDNIQVYSQFVIFKQSEEVLRKLVTGIGIILDIEEHGNETYESLAENIANMLSCHCTEED